MILTKQLLSVSEFDDICAQSSVSILCSTPIAVNLIAIKISAGNLNNNNENFNSFLPSINAVTGINYIAELLQ